MGSESVPVSTDTFKSAMRRFATGVTIVTTAHADSIHGFTVNAFASVTAEPPTVLVCVNKNARAHPLISESGGFCVNILGLEQRGIAETFTTAEPKSRFDGLAHRRGPTGSPILDGVLAYVDCKVEEEMTAGTHTIFIGRVLEVGDREGAPLGYFDRAYRDFHLGP
jgi:flavin reductase (DIM6/NTAB) family NADH-FMN oxidoreductase RutF